MTRPRPFADLPPAERWTRVVAAVEMAFELHGAQTRKGSGVPYVGHLLGVASLVIDDGGDEDQVIAALLHDGPEDQGGRRTLAEIGRRFGPQVVAIVEACTDTFDDPKPPWRPRKEQWLAGLPAGPPDAWRVELADKLHNARAIVSDVRRDGVGALDKFNGGRDGTLWYYRRVAEVLGSLAPGSLASELLRTVEELESLTAQ
jgi:(p)ppGpp synthase/HD superfamily hydrolase